MEVADPAQPVSTDAPLPSPQRLGAVLMCVALLLIGLIGRVAYLQTAFAAEAAGRAERQHVGRTTVAARRGSIFDRNGLMLAGTVQMQSIFADPQFMHEQFADTGGSWFELDLKLERVAERADANPGEVALAVGRDPDRRYVQIARGLSDEEAEDVVQLASEVGLRGIGRQPEPRRLYPMGAMAAHILGAVGRDDVGLEGLERLEDELLRGTDGSFVTQKDKRRRSIAAGVDGYRPPRHGAGLMLTIDSQIQLIAEQELAATCQAFDAEGGSIVILDPHSGAVLALANYPTYYPEYLTDSTPEARRNRAIVDPYEPGSVVKPFLLAGLLEKGVTRLDEVLETGKTTRLPIGRRVTDDYGYPELAAWDFVVKSSNIGMSKISSRVDYHALTSIYRRFGFGEETGIEQSGENSGLLYKNPPDKYTASSISFGYAMMATPMQLARAASVFANGGRLISPHLIAGVVRDNGELEVDVHSHAAPEVLKKETADQMRRILADVFARGTARIARSDKYNFFGKTGTSHKSENGRQSDTKYFASFVGGGPYESPRLVICVTINEPSKEKGHHGGQVSATTAARVLERSLTYLGVPNSPPLPEPPEYIQDVLFNYSARDYEPKRRLTAHPSEDTNEALEAREE